MERKWWTLVAVAAGIFMLLLDVTIVNVALPDIEKAFDASLSDLQWVIDAYALTLAALQLTAGSLADRFGRRLLFAIGIVVFTLGSLLCGLASGSTFLSLSRAFQGIGGAIMFATGLALIANAFHGRDRGVAFGVFGAVTGVAVAVGPVIGGALTSGLSWRWIFLVNIPVGIAALYLTLRSVDESRDPNPRPVDVLGLGTFSLGLAALVYGLIRSSEDGWSSGTVVGSLVAAAVLLIAFVAVEALQKQPMFDLSLFRKPTFVGGLIAAFAISASLFSQFPYLVIYMQAGLGLSAIDIGVRFLVLSGPIFITAAIAGRLTEKVPTRFLIGPGFLFVGIAQLLMRGLEPGSEWTHFIPGFLVAGHRRGLHQRAAREHRGRRRRARPGGDGERDQLDAAPGRHRHRRRRAGRDLLPPRERRGQPADRVRGRPERDPAGGRDSRAGRGGDVADPDPEQGLRADRNPALTAIGSQRHAAAARPAA